PRLRAIGVPAFSPVVRVLYFGHVEILLPIRTLLLKRRRTVANFDPPSRAIRAEPGVAHVAQVFALGDGALAQSAPCDGLEKAPFAAGFHTGAYEISHAPLF